MLGYIRLRLRDMRILKNLFLQAEKLANADGRAAPGAEHLVLSALALPDGTAAKALLRFSVEPSAYRKAIEQQYVQALQSVGIQVPESLVSKSISAPQGTGVYASSPSAQQLLQTLGDDIMVKQRATHRRMPLMSAHVLLAACKAKQGVAVRAFRALGIDTDAMVTAAQAEIAAAHVV